MNRCWLRQPAFAPNDTNVSYTDFSEAAYVSCRCVLEMRRIGVICVRDAVEVMPINKFHSQHFGSVER